MAKRKNNTKAPDPNSATIGYEAQLWQMADALRGSMDAAEYKHVVLGLIFLKYISDAFEELHAKLVAEQAQGADPEDPDEYRAENVFWVPPEARWEYLKAQARQSTIGRLVDDAMDGIERDNPALKGVLPKDYARPALDKQRLGQLIDLISNIKIGDEEARAKDVLGRVYEYFLSQFASAEGKKGGEFYTPRCVVKLLVEMLEPYRGRVYDPCCGSSGMFVQSVEFIRAHASGNSNGGKTRALPARGQALAVRRTARRQRQLRLGAAHRPPPGARGRGRLRARQRLNVVQPVRRGRDPQEPDRSRPRGLHGGAARPALLLDADPGVPVVPGEGRRRPASTPTCPVSARARRWTKCASTATSSRLDVTSAPRRSRTTANRSRRRCGGSPRRCASSRPRPRGSTPPSQPT